MCQAPEWTDHLYFECLFVADELGLEEGRSWAAVWRGMVLGLSMVKVTFTLDDDTVERLRRVASRLARPQSQVVREAIKDYEARSGKLSEEERRRMLDVFDAVVPKLPRRSAATVDAELRRIRQARRRWGRLRPARPR